MSTKPPHILTLQKCLEQKDLPGLKSLLRLYPGLFHLRDCGGQPLIHRCVMEGVVDLNLIEMFYAAGGDVNVRSDAGVTLLGLVMNTVTLSSDTKKEFEQFLKKKGASASLIEEAVFFCTRGSLDVESVAAFVRMTREHPTLAQQRGPQGYTLLHHVVKRSHVGLVKHLLGLGADCNAVSYTGVSVLGCASIPSVDPAIYAMLIEHGARLTQVETIREMLKAKQIREVIQMLSHETRLVNAFDPIFGSLLNVAMIFAKDVELVAFLLRAGADVNAHCELSGNTPLHTAARFPAAIPLLLEYKAEINATNRLGRTPLHEAVFHDDEVAVHLLVEAGAEVNIKDANGCTPLDDVYECRYPGYRDVAKYLSLHGAIASKRKKGHRSKNDNRGYG